MATVGWARGPGQQTPGAHAAVVALASLALALHLVGLGGGTLDAWDEALSAERAREMMEAGSWWTPLLGGEPDWNKPPLYYWLVIAGYRAFGVGEFAVRLPSALFGLACAVLVFALGRRLTGSRGGGLLAVALLLANPHWLETTRQGLLDSGYTAAMLAGAWALASWSVPSAGRAIAGGALIGLGAAIKNPLAVLAFAMPLAAWRVEGSEVDTKARPRRQLLVLAIAAFVAVGGAWYVSEALLYGRAFVDFQLGYNFWERATTAIEGHRTGVGLYARKWLEETPVTFVAFAVPLGWAVLRDRATLRRVAPLLAFVAAWLVAIHVAVSKRPVYLAPLHPFVAAASAPLCLACWRSIESERARRATAAVFAIAAIAVLAGRYDPKLDFSPEVAAAARKAAARAAPGETIYGLDVPLQLVGFYARRDVRRLDPAPFAPGDDRAWLVATQGAAEALRDRLREQAPQHQVSVECATPKACVVAIGAERD